MTVEEILALDINPTAKLVAVVSATLGITDVDMLCKTTKLSRRTIYRARADFDEAACASSVTDGTNSVPLVPNLAQNRAASAKLGTDGTGSAGEVYITTRATKELPTEVLISKIDSPFCPPGDEKRVKFEKGELSIFGELRQFWIDQFGGDEQALDLAVIQAAGYVQPNSFRPLEAQVSAQLAKTARERRERDQRYERAANSPTAKPTASAARMDYGQARIDRSKAFLDRLKSRKPVEANQ